MKKKLIAILAAVALCVNITACSKNNNGTNSNTVTESAKESQINVETVKSESVGEADTFIELGSNISVDGDGITVENNKVTITSAGTYSISGKLDDGQIIVNAGAEEKVYIILNGVDITSSSSAPIYVMNSKKTIISLADNTENNITDGENYVFEDTSTDEPNAAIFSKDDLIFIGNGSLTVNANFNHGIVSKDDLAIQSGNISVNSKNDGIKGRDSINITDGNIVINSKGDGMQANNDEDVTKGYVYISGGTINITAEQDGIQAETQALIANGDINISSGGGSVNSSTSESGSWGDWGVSDKMPGEGMRPDAGMKPAEGFDTGMTPPEAPEGVEPGMTPPEDNTLTTDPTTGTGTTEESTSAKAIKAGTNIIIEGGNIDIDSSDDSIHSNDSLTISGGTMNLSSGDDGIHSDSTLTIDGGNINITKSYEGIESEVITINGGDINVTSSDDGINAAGGNDGSSTNGRPGENSFSDSSSGKININGGQIAVNASGDGIDANGSIYMASGTVIVNGPTNGGNGSLDYDGTFELSGGTLITAGSAGMAQTPSDSSTQNIINVNLTSQEANTIVHIESDSGEEIVTFAPSKSYQTVTVSTPNIKSGETYTVYVGGSSSGTATNGVYSNGTYSGGSEVGSATVSDIITNVTQEGASSGGNMGMPGGKGQGGEGKPGRGEAAVPPTDTPTKDDI